ncbi:MAG: hypothetical protein GY811_30805 [Myxococcales bacterium]|nr:hypothetical protein [Myxococcales bacterium]
MLESTDEMLRYLEEYLGMPMPFRKLDFIAVPRFGGAMENPGLITFSSAILLIGKSADAAAQRRALGVTAHELAHLWFGDFITPDYWNDLWLNEAFATWLSVKAVAIAQPDQAYEVLDIADKTAAYEIDHGLDGRRVRETIMSRDDIRASFDRITYRKGGAILTMLEGWLGEERMRDGVRRYLRNADGGTVVAEGLIASMEEPSGNIEIKRFFTTFLTQTGIPQIHASVQCNGAGPPKLTLRQSRYLPLETRPRQTKEDRKRRWHIPVCVRYPSDASGTATVRQCTDLGEVSAQTTLKTKSCPAWLLPNDGDTGYYHYMLSADGFARLPLDQLSPKESLGLVHSVSAAMHAGDLNIEQGLGLLERMLAVKSIKVHEVIHEILYELANSVIGDRERPAFAAMIRRWYRPIVQQVGVTPRPQAESWMTEVRPTLMLLLADLGEDPALQRQVRRHLEAWLDDPVKIDLLLLNSWLQVAALGADEALATRYKDAMRSTRNRYHKFLFSGALHGFRNPKLLASPLARNQRSPAAWPVLAGAMRYPALRKIVFEALKPSSIVQEEAASLFAPMCDKATSHPLLNLR